VNSEKDESIVTEVDGRLNSLFADEDSEEVGAAPIEGLKAAVLAIDWEITEGAMARFGEEIEAVSEELKDDMMLLTFLKLLKSLGKYLNIKKGDAHPDSVKLLHSVYADFERITGSPEMGEKDIQQILSKDINRFKELKEQVSYAGNSAARKESEKDVESRQGTEEVLEEEPAPVPVYEQDGRREVEERDLRQAHEAFAYALDELKEVIKSEFRALRAEIRLWRDGK